jgi:L-ribulokinase
MGNGFETEYHPNPENAAKYEKLYEQYSQYGQVIEAEIMKSR